MEKALEIIHRQMVEHQERRVSDLETRRNKIAPRVLPPGKVKRLYADAKSKLFSRKLRRLDLDIGQARRNLEKIKSNEFASQLQNYEPWRLERRSLERGTNLHLKLAQGHASDGFKQWVARLASRHGVPEKEVWAGVIETIRKAQWETMKQLIEKRQFQKRALPFSIISDFPTSSLFVAENIALKTARKRRGTAGLFDKHKALLQLHPNAALHLGIMDLGESVKRLGGRPLILASSGSQIIALHEQVLQQAFEEYRHFQYPTEAVRSFFGFIARETGAIAMPRQEFQALNAKLRSISHKDIERRVALEDKAGLKAFQEIGRTEVGEKHAEVFAPFLSRLKLN